MFRALLLSSLFMLLMVNPKLSIADECDDINLLAEYGVIGEDEFDSGNNSEINGNPITGNGNTPTPTGVSETVNLNFPDIDPLVFPATGGADLEPPSPPAVAAGSYGTIEFERRNNGSTLSFTGGDYFIEELILKKGATVQFAPGNYFIEAIDFDNQSKIVISPSGQVNIYIKDSFQAGNETEINTAGNTGNLVFYLYNSASFQLGNANNGSANVDFNGIIYSPYRNTSIDFGNNNNIKGAILSAGSVDVGNNTTFDYSAAVQDEVIGALGCTPTVTGPDHYQISHSGIGVTCEAEAVVVTAHDASHVAMVPPAATTIALSTSIANDGWALKSGNGTFAPPNQYTFDGVESTVEFWLRKTTATLAPHMDIDVSDGIATDLDDAGAEDLALAFSDTALRFYADGVHNSIGTQLAGKSSAVIPGNQTLTLRAVQTNTDTGACQARVSGTRSVQISYDCVDPANCKNSNGVSVTDTTLNVPTTISDTAPGSNVNLNFDANGIATWTLSYADAGQISLSAILDIVAVGNDPADTLAGTSNTFLSKPAGLCVTTTDADSSCVSGDASCTKFKKAGEPFNLRVQAVGWDTLVGGVETNTGFCTGNAITPNFELSTISLSQNLVAPAGSAGTLGINSFDMLLTENGEHTEANQTISEVGVFTFTATPPAYFGESIAASTSANVGRFYPDHFVLSDTTLTNRSDLACLPASTFTYMSENFEVSYDLTAKSVGGVNATQNYIGGFAKLNTAAELRYAALDLTGPTDLTTRLSPGVPVINFVAGVANDITDTLSFSRLPTVPDGEYTVSVGIAPLDDDLVELNSYNLDVAGGGNDHALVEQVIVYYGRMVLSNAFGSELVPLTIPLRAQIYDAATASFVGNILDNCSAFNVSGIDLSAASYVAPLAASDLGLSGAGNLVAGGAQFSMHDNASPLSGPGVTGEVLYTMAFPSYLQFDWNGDSSFNDNPAAKASFGIFNGNSRQIYFRQIFQ
jgi:hypothetical protein